MKLGILALMAGLTLLGAACGGDEAADAFDVAACLDEAAAVRTTCATSCQCFGCNSPSFVCVERQAFERELCGEECVMGCADCATACEQGHAVAQSACWDSAD